MSTITVTYTPQSTGSHRICYRVQATPANTYCCEVDVTPSVIGVPKNYIITIGAFPCGSVPGVDLESCDPVVYEGYVQPVCEEESSLAERSPWSTNFVVVPTCKQYDIACIVSGVQSILITNKGSGYNPGVPPNVTIDAPTGAPPVQATGLAIVGLGVASAGFIIFQGAGYTNGVYPNCPLTGGSGAGLLATVVITLGQISSITITNGGTGYLVGDVVAPDTFVVGVPGVAGSYQITVSDYGEVNSVTITNPGDGYIVVPNVVFDPPPGPGVTTLGTAQMEPCASFAGTDCEGADVDPNIEIAFLDTKTLCSKGPIVLPAEYSVGGGVDPCCNCVEYQITVLSGVVPQIYYTQCIGSSTRDMVELINQVAPFSINVCAINDSVGVTPGYEANVLISLIGPCP